MRVFKINVKPQESRIDKFLARKIKSLTRSQVKKFIKEGNILVNHQKVEPDYEVKKGDVITFEVPPPKPLEIKGEPLPLKIVYEDDCFLVIDKESGIVVHPTADHTSGTLVNAIIYHLKKLPGIGENLRPGIVHRLDKGTSGLIVVGKTEDCVADLKSQFKQRKVVKRYLVLVGGKLERAESLIDKPIARHPKHRQKFIISDLGRQAQTVYKVLERFGDKFTLVEAQPKTGRTHQIRVHFSSLGHPVVGDKLYRGKPAPRMFLHASYLEFTHPKSKKRVSYESPLPSKLQEILGKIKKKESSS